MEELLKPVEWRVYSLLYIENLSESQAATRMGYKTNEQNRSPGYKQITNIKKSIITKVKKHLDRNDIDII